jgi:hypothetical protein
MQLCGFYPSLAGRLKMHKKAKRELSFLGMTLNGESGKSGPTFSKKSVQYLFLLTDNPRRWPFKTLFKLLYWEKEYSLGPHLH